MNDMRKIWKKMDRFYFEVTVFGKSKERHENSKSGCMACGLALFWTSEI
jgi:hypothetical protein